MPNYTKQAELFLNKRSKQKNNLVITRQEAISGLNDFAEMIVKKKNKEQEQNYFGITTKDIHEILTKQNFECAVCGMPLLTYSIIDNFAVCDKWRCKSHPLVNPNWGNELIVSLTNPTEKQKKNMEFIEKQGGKCAICGEFMEHIQIVDGKAVCDNDICNKKH